MVLLDLILKFVALATFVIGGIALYIAVWSNSRQLAAQIFLAYSDRVRAIRSVTSNDFSRPEAISEAIYLIFEFHSLRRRGYVPSSIWEIWEADMTHLLNTAGFRELWPNIRSHFENHPHFLIWVADRQRFQNQRTSARSPEEVYEVCH